MGQEKITLTKAELKKVLVIEKLVARQLKVAEAAEFLQLSTRQVLRLKHKYITEGAEGIAHKNRGRKPAHTIPDEVKKLVAERYRTTYYGSNNCHYSDLLEERESLRLSVSSVRRILLSQGIKQAKQRRRPKAHSVALTHVQQISSRMTDRLIDKYNISKEMKQETCKSKGTWSS
jgi:transposase